MYIVQYILLKKKKKTIRTTTREIKNMRERYSDIMRLEFEWKEISRAAMEKKTLILCCN